MKKDQTILITGIAGFIGMHTAIKYLKEGYTVIGLDNINDYYSISLKEDRINNIINHSKTLNLFLATYLLMVYLLANSVLVVNYTLFLYLFHKV